MERVWSKRKGSFLNTMQGRNTNPNDRFRSGYRNSNRFGDHGGSWGGGDQGFDAESDLSPPHPWKEEILMEAGRLAAEYLASKGLLPRDSLSPKWGSNHKLEESRGRDRDRDRNSSPIDRCNTYDAGNRRRRYRDDEYSRDRFRGRKRMGGYYNREYSFDWGRDGGRRSGRNRGYSDRIEDEDDYPRDHHRHRRGRYDRLPSSSEFTSELGSGDHDNAEDSGLKGSYLSTRKDPPTESYVDLSKTGERGRMGSSENEDELESDTSGDLNMRNMVEEEEEANIVLACGVEGDGKSDSELAKLCGFPKVLTRPQSYVSQTSQKIDDQEIVMEASNTAEVASDVPKVAAGEEDPREVDSLANQSATLKTQVNDTLSIILTQPMEESVNSGQELNQIPPLVTEEEVAMQREGGKRQREPSPFPKDEYSGQDNLRARKSSLEEKRLLMDVDKVATVAAYQENPVEQTCFPEIDPEVDVKLEEEKQLLPTSFKICDLNLIHTDEITEIPDDPVPSHVPAPVPAPSLDTGKEISMDCGLSVGVHNNGTDDCRQLPTDDKVIQVTDLEDESHMEANRCDTSRPKDEPMIYPNMNSLLSHAELPDIQGSYSLELSEFLRTDISRCPSVPSDLGNLLAGTALHDAEGVPNEDDPIYALREVPIGFMEVWDQSSQDYGKLF